MTFTEAKKQARALGWTMRHNDGEYICYPLGTGQDDPRAIFESDAESALKSVQHAAQIKPGTESRDPATAGPAILVTIDTAGEVRTSAHATLADAITCGEGWQVRNGDDPNWVARLSIV